MSLKAQLQRWQKYDVIDAATAERIRIYEKSRQGARFSTAMFGLGALAIVLGIAALVGANWDAIPAGLKLAAHGVANLGVAAGVIYCLTKGKSVAREILLFLLAGLTLTFIALIGQVYQTDAPHWQALTLWMALVSPFLFLLARARFTIVCWVLAFYGTLASLFGPVEDWLRPYHLQGAFYAFIPFLMILVGHNRFLQTRWPVWPSLLAFGGYALVVLLVSSELAFSAWNGKIFPTDYLVAMGTGFAAALGIAALRRSGWLVIRPFILDLFLIVSVVAGFAPWFLPAPARFFDSNVYNFWKAVNAVLFMAYWALVGWTGLRLGYRWLLNLAVILIAVRLLVVYMEVFGSLLSTGFGLILSGVVLIALVWGTNAAIRKLRRGA